MQGAQLFALAIAGEIKEQRVIQAEAGGQYQCDQMEQIEFDAERAQCGDYQ